MADMIVAFRHDSRSRACFALSESSRLFTWLAAVQIAAVMELYAQRFRKLVGGTSRPRV
jgi:hypothetical protein